MAKAAYFFSFLIEEDTQNVISFYQPGICQQK